MDRNADPMIRLDRVSKRYPDGTVAVRELSLDVAAGDLVTLVGPSGCGKTTVLKMVNRLIEPSSGRIVLDGDDVTEIDATRLRRRIGYVIQQVGLFPHRTVLENTMTVPMLLGWPRARAGQRAKDLLALVGLDPDQYGARYPHQLSGGQRQRVGVARALAADPPVLLMDEPFGAVDPLARESLQSEFRRLQAEVRKTILFVTHDIEEAVLLGDKVAVFSQGGGLEQFAPPAELLGAPANDFVADFVGTDRALKRLAVTPIVEEDLERPPVVFADDPLADAASALDAQSARWAIVLNGDGSLSGWLSRDRAHGDGIVRDRGRQMTARVPAGSSLKRAISMMLQHDAGWVAVVDGGRFLGVLTPESLHLALRRSAEGDRKRPETAGTVEVPVAVGAD